MEFDKWLEELDKVARKNGHTTDYSKDTGKECWKEYFEDGFAPEDAYAEDCSSGAQ